MMSDGALSFAGFFFFFLIHTGFCIWSAVAPGFVREGQDYAHTGWLPALQLFKEDGGGSKFAAICYSVGTFSVPPSMCMNISLVAEPCTVLGGLSALFEE